MFQENLLRAEMLKTNADINKMAEVINVDTSTFYRKLSRDGDFSREEMAKMIKYLKISNPNVMKIFFA